MEKATIDPVAEAFAAFHAQFGPLFGRVDTQRRAAQYVRGILAQHAERRNAENLAETVGATPRSFQRLLTDSPWDHRRVIDAVQALLARRLNADDGIWMLEEIGFAKDGEHSVGVAYQRKGAMSKGCNCQVGVFLVYASSRGQALVDGQLYLPKSWADDNERRRAAGVPESVTYQSKQDLGQALLQRARARGHLRSQWVIGAGEYGADPALRDALDRAGWLYMLQVPASIVVFTPPAVAKMPLFSWGGRRGRPRMIACAPGRQTVEAFAASMAPDVWLEHQIGDGTNTVQRYRVAVQRVWEDRAGERGPEGWLVLRRNLDGGDVMAHLSNASMTIAPETLGRVSTPRSYIAPDLERQQAAPGLAEYEVRSWPGWHHHVSLSLLAAAFLLQQAWKS